MRIFFCIRKSMVHTVHNSICPGIQKGSALEHVRCSIKNPFPEPVHPEHFMRRIPVKKKGLTK